MKRTKKRIVRRSCPPPLIPSPPLPGTPNSRLLPKPNVVRCRATTDTVVPPSGMQNCRSRDHATFFQCERCSIREKQSSIHQTPRQYPNAAPRYCRTESITHPRSPATTFPHTIPLSMMRTTPTPIARAASSVPRPVHFARISAANLTSCESHSQSFTRFLAPTTSPPPGRPPYAPHMQGKTPMSSPFAPSSKLTTGPGAPPAPISEV